MGSETILTQLANREKIIAAIYTFLSLKCIIIAATIGAFLAIVLFVFTLVLDALIDLCTHVAQVWNGSSSLERLLIFGLAWLVFYKATPFLAWICKQGKGF